MDEDIRRRTIYLKHKYLIGITSDVRVITDERDSMQRALQACIQSKEQLQQYVDQASVSHELTEELLTQHDERKAAEKQHADLVAKHKKRTHEWNQFGEKCSKEEAKNKKRIEELEKQNTNFSEQLTGLHEMLQDERNLPLSEKVKPLLELSDAKKNHQEATRSHARTVMDLETKVESLKKQLKSSEQVVLELGEARKSLANLSNDLFLAENAKKAAVSALDKANRDANAVDDKLRKCRTSLSDTRDERDEARRQLQQNILDVISRDNTIRSQSKEILKAQSERDQYKEDLEKSTDRENDLSRQVKKLKERTGQLEEEILKAQSQRDQHKRSLERSSNRENGLSREVTKLKERTKHLEDEIKELDDLRDQDKAVFEELERDIEDLAATNKVLRKQYLTGNGN